MCNVKGLTIIIFLMSILVYSCAVFDVSYSKKPEKVAEKFLKHFYKFEYEKAKKYGTTRTGQLIDMMDQLVAVSGKKVLPENSKLVMLDCNTKGDTAICNYLVNDVKSEVMLLKIDGKWLVDMKKETSGKSGKKDFIKLHDNKDENNKKN
jgi:hypothetical protein